MKMASINSTVCSMEQIDVIASLLSGRLVRERIGPAMLSAVQSQVTSHSNFTINVLDFDD